MKAAVTAIVIVFAATAFAGGPSDNFPREFEGILHEWQSRASLWPSEICTGNQCEPIGDVSGEMILLGAVYHYGNVGIFVEFNEGCIFDGEMCGDAFPVEMYRMLLPWNDDAGCYLQVVETSESEAEFDAVTMVERDLGFLRVGVFDVRGNGKVYKYSKDAERRVWELRRWWPELPPDPGPV